MDFDAIAAELALSIFHIIYGRCSSALSKGYLLDALCLEPPSPRPSAPTRGARRRLPGTGLSACGGSDSSSAGQEVDDAHVTIASTAISNSLDPTAALSSVGRTYAKQVFDQLVVFDANGEIQPSIATAWKRVDDTTMEFTLRGDATFSTGAKVDAAAVAANIKNVLSGNPAYANVAGRLSTVKDATAVSADVLRVVTKSADPILLNRMTLFDIVDPATFGKDRPAGSARSRSSTTRRA